MNPILKTFVSFTSGVAIAVTMSSAVMAFNFTPTPENDNEFIVKTEYINDFMTMLLELIDDDLTGEVKFTFNNVPGYTLVTLPETTEWYALLQESKSESEPVGSSPVGSSPADSFDTAETVPEPGTIVGLLTVTGLGLVSRRRNQNSKLN